MQNFKFSLDRVLDFKNQMLDREKNLLAQLRQQRNEVENAIEELRQEFQRVNKDMADKSSRGVTVHELRGGQYQLDALREDISQKELEKQFLEQEVEKQLQIVLKMSQEVSGLDKLKEQQKEAFDQHEAKVAEVEIAEFVSGKLIRNMQAQ